MVSGVIMPKVWVKDPADHTWKQAKQVYVNIGGGTGGWTPLRKGYVNQGGINKLFYPDYQGNVTYNVPGLYYYTVPNGITSLQFIVAGAGGGGGGHDGGGPGHAGYAGNVVTFTSNVTPGNIYLCAVGAPGVNGYYSGSAVGGAGGSITNALFKGGQGGNAGGSGSSGSGGGGGMASYILTVASNTAVTGSNVAVAAGGGGGGGAGRFSDGYGQDATSYNSTSDGAQGTSTSGDGAGGGGGGGGYTYGGAGGALTGGDNGAYSGINGQSLVPSGGSVSIGTNGGAAETTGSSGYITIVPII